MRKFEVKECDNRWGAQVFKIVDNNHNYLHSDGVVYPCGEYWPTREQAQAVLDKFQPAPPPHVWTHGDVFENSAGVFIYFEPYGGKVTINVLRSKGSGTPNIQLPGSTFLFNIKDALSDRGLV
jgi:hypothetical protein